MESLSHLFAPGQEPHVEKKSYIIQSPVALGLESPKVNLPIAGEAKSFSLSEEEVVYLRGLIPNIKIVPVAPVEARVPAPPAPEVIQETGNVSSLVEEELEEDESADEEVETEAPAVTSKSMNARQAIEYIQTHSQEELEGFMDPMETRNGVKAAWAEKFPTEVAESTTED